MVSSGRIFVSYAAMLRSPGWTGPGTRAVAMTSSRRRRLMLLPLPDGRQLAMLHWPGRGPPLVLLHGLLDSSAGWSRLAKATRRPVYAFDLPGFGASDPPRYPRISAYAEDIAFACDLLELDDYALVGHSLGGAVATRVAELDAEHCGSLCLVAPAGYGRIILAETIWLPLVRESAHMWVTFGLRFTPIVDGFYRLLVANGHAIAPELAGRLRDGAPASLPGVRAAVEAVVAAGRSPRAFHRRQIDYTGPVSAVWGGADRLVPAGHRRGVAAAFPHARIVVWPRVGHHPQVEQPHALAQLIRRHAGRPGPTDDSQPISRDEPPEAQPPRASVA
jgi:pimeloyl-ACP methyl ester carboxylesterase